MNISLRSVVFIVFVAASVSAQEARVVQPAAKSGVETPDESYTQKQLLIEKGTLNLLNKDYEGALTLFTRLVELEPVKFRPHYLLGITQFRLKNYEAAVSELEKAVAKYDKSSEAWQVLGYSYVQLKEYAKGQDCFRKVIEISPNISEGFNNLGQTYLYQRNLPEATTAFSAALRLKPNMIESLRGLCVTHALNKQFAETIDVCRRAYDVRPSFDLNYYRALALVELDRFDEAFQLLQSEVNANPQKTEPYLALGLVYTRAKRYVEASAEYQKALELSPNLVAGYAGLGYIAYATKDFRGARELYEKAASLEPAASTVKFNLAVTCLTMKRRDCALEQYSVLKGMDTPFADELFSALFQNRIVKVPK